MVPVDRLKDLPLFAGLPDPVRALLAERLESRSVKSGDTLFAEGDPGDAVYFVLSGRVAIQKTLDAAKGTFKTLAVLGAGDFFGEMALLEKEDRSAAAVAAADGEVLSLSAKDFGRWLADDSKIPLKFLLPFVTTLSARLRDTTREMAAFFEVSRVLVQNLEIKDMAGRLLDVMAQPFNGEIQGAFFVWDPFGSEYEGVAAVGGWPERLRTARPSTDPLFYWMAEKGECLLAPDWESDARFIDAVRAQWPAFRSVLAAPVPGDKRPAGFMVLGHNGERGFFTAGHRRTLASVANLIAPAFENAALQEERRAEERLRRARLDRR